MRREYATWTGDLRPHPRYHHQCTIPVLRLHCSPSARPVSPSALLPSRLATGCANVRSGGRRKISPDPFSARRPLDLCCKCLSLFLLLTLPPPYLTLSRCLSLTLFPSDVFWAEKSKFQHAQIVWHFITWNVDAEAVEMIEIE